MEMAQTFYCIGTNSSGASSAQSTTTSTTTSTAGRPSGVNRQYLQGGLAGHPLWRSMDFWESVVYDAVSNDANRGHQHFKAVQPGGAQVPPPSSSSHAHARSGMSSLFNKSTSGGGTSGSASGGATSAAVLQKEREREVAVAIGQLRLCAFTMLSFGVPSADVQRIVVDKYGRFLGLDTAGMAGLAVAVEGFAHST